MIWITGDIHGEIDVSKLNSRNWPEGKSLTKDDYLIVLGDFGFLWVDEPDKQEKWWINWLTNKSWTTLFIDGNHENHNRLKQLEVINKFGGKVGCVSESIYHLRRGEYYRIDGMSFFAFGGAKSQDIECRIDQINWWPEEIPTVFELEHGLENLKKNGNLVDFVLFHTIPYNLKEQFTDHSFLEKMEDPTCKLLDKIIDVVEFNHGFSGHLHVDVDKHKWSVLYKRILRLPTFKVVN